MSGTPEPVAAGVRRRRLLLATLLLFLPALVPTLAHLLDHRDGEPSGFIHLELPYYAANAREHFDDGGFRLLYGLPFSADPGTPRLYVQPQSLLLGGLMRAGLDPALAMTLMGVAGGLASVLLALLVFERLAGLSRAAHWLAAIAWIWGGGLFVAAGAANALRSGNPDDLFALDPADGTWFLNFGRNLTLPTEAWWHALWLAALLQVLRRKPASALAMAALLCASHPFSGLQLAAVLVAWTALEAFWIRGPEVRPRHAAACLLLLAAHLAYYVGILRTSPEHRVLMSQWIDHSQDWTYEARHFLPAYALVGVAVAWVLRTPSLAARVLARPEARLLATWAAVSLLLANNEMFLRPCVQPLHFTRGYDWMPLFLLGAPAVVAAFDALLRARRRMAGVAACAALLAAWLLDNAAYLGTFPVREHMRQRQVRLEPGFRELAAWLSLPENEGALLVTDPAPGGSVLFDGLPYLLMAYTPLRAWKSHPFNTPDVLARHAEIDAAFAAGTPPDAWAHRRLVVIIRGGRTPPRWITERGGRLGYQDPLRAAWVVPPVIGAPPFASHRGRPSSPP